jgi:Family of unknown function (DUF6328)
MADDRQYGDSGAGGNGESRTHGFGRHEKPEERADRRWVEMLQEVRVAQTGAQILFGFLLSVAFTPRFAGLGGLDKGLYVVTVALGALATATLIAPVAFHRTLAGHRRKPELVDLTQRLITAGLAFLASAVVCSILLLLRVAVGGGFAWFVAAVVAAAFALCWLALPLMLRRRMSREP